jgi:hypothetical protein
LLAGCFCARLGAGCWVAVSQEDSVTTRTAISKAVWDELLEEATRGGIDAAVGIRGMRMTFKVARMGGGR